TMPPMWYKLLKIVLLLFALFTTLPAKDLETILGEIFQVNHEEGVHLFNTTIAGSAPLMPINTMLGDQPQNPNPHTNTNQNQKQSPNPRSTSHYHQYHSLSQKDQYFKVQRSPDGKLNLVFNDTFVSLQGTNPQTQSDQAATTRIPNSGPIVFPGTEHQALAQLAPKNRSVEQQCADDPKQMSKSFCTQVENYPDLSGLKLKLGMFAKFFNDEPQPTDVSARVGAADEIYLCKSNRRIMYPKKGQKTDDTWQLIVNDKDYKQGILVEECQYPDEPCDFKEMFPQNYKPICRQHYVTRTLASIVGGDVVPDVFKIPSCCKCALINT
ncbi:hypothetical protein KR009_003390, partial [Drosophila setifemur]